MLFVYTKVHYLKHIVIREEIHLEPAKLKRISDWPEPEKGTKLASLLGLCNYFRELILSFAHISGPLFKVSR